MENKQTETHDGQRNSADVIIIDALPPEEGAMSQAIYSRKPKSILYTILAVLKKGAQSFMSIFYSGYGHNSIGDCGSLTLYLENVSMLSAKAFQSPSLYNGQEASTRYLDFSGRTIINPLGGQLQTHYLYIPKEKLNEEDIEKIDQSFIQTHTASSNVTADETGKMIQEKWMALYEKSMPKVKAWVAKSNPKKPEEDQVQYDKAVNARAFDIMRCLIPAGMTTLVSWHSNIRQLRDRLAILKYHPAPEISRVAQTALAGLQATYPASFPQKDYPETEEYLKLKADKVSYFDSDVILHNRTFKVDWSRMDFGLLQRNYRELLKTRPAKNELPNEVGEAGTARVQFLIDFGSFRDAQRHRKGVCKMPLLTTKFGFHEWYLQKMPDDVCYDVLQLIEELVPVINALPCSKEDRQYYIPMGFKVIADFTWSIDQCIYVAELRSSETVHPTFRVYAQELGKQIETVMPYAALHVDYSEDRWSYKRGAQDIKEKV